MPLTLGKFLNVKHPQGRAGSGSEERGRQQPSAKASWVRHVGPCSTTTAMPIGALRIAVFATSRNDLAFFREPLCPWLQDRETFDGCVRADIDQPVEGVEVGASENIIVDELAEYFAVAQER